MIPSELREIIEYQESLLQFERFTFADALELGLCIVETAKEYGFSLATSIVLNELEVFRCFMDGTTINNDIWMKCKRNTMRATGHSSLHFVYTLAETGKTQEDLYMRRDEYAASGGGFPIYLRDTGVIGYACVSGLAHETDHKVLVESMAKKLGIELGCPLPEATGY